MKSKFPLGWILAVAALVLLAAMGFMSSYYHYGGKKLAICIIVAACLIAVPVVLTTMLIKLKGVTKPFFFRSNAFKELCLLIVMLAGCIVSMGLVDHFFTVNSRAKDIGKITENFDDAYSDMNADYDEYAQRRKSEYMGNLNLVVKRGNGNERNRIAVSYVIDSLHLDTTDVEKLKNQIAEKGKLFYNNIQRPNNTESGSDTETAASIYKKKGWWELPKLLNYADSLAAPIQSYYKQLLVRSENGTADITLLDKMGASIEAKEKCRWSYSFDDSVDIKHYFTEREGFVSHGWSVLVALVAFALALLPYLAAYRDPRSKGLKEIFKKSPKYV